MSKLRHACWTIRMGPPFLAKPMLWDKTFATRKDAIAAWRDGAFAEPWPHWRKQGVSAVRVELREL